MNKQISSDNYLSILSTEEDVSIITLVPCDYESSEEDDYVNLSQNSIDSSELLDDSDDEGELITEIFILNTKLDKKDETNSKIDEIISV